MIIVIVMVIVLLCFCVILTFSSGPSMSRLRKSTVGLPRASRRLYRGRHCMLT